NLSKTRGGACERQTEREKDHLAPQRASPERETDEEQQQRHREVHCVAGQHTRRNNTGSPWQRSARAAAAKVATAAGAAGARSASQAGKGTKAS
ncbi:unnamed protein product, partial [Ectocarpus sp. 12 AP-2014]